MSVSLSFYIHAFLITVISLFFSVLVRENGDEGLPPRSFSISSVFAGLWGVTLLMTAYGAAWEKNYFTSVPSLFVAILFAASFYHFILTFLKKRGTQTVIAAYASSIIFLAVVTVCNLVGNPAPLISGPGILYASYGFIFLFLVGSSLFILFREYLKGENRVQRHRILSLILAGSAAATGIFVVPFLWRGFSFFQNIMLLTLLYPVLGSITVSIDKRLFIRTAFREILILAGVLAFLYPLIAMLQPFEVLARDHFHSFIPFAALLVVLLVRAVGKVVGSLVDGFFFKHKFAHKDLFGAFSKEVLSVLDLQGLLDITVNKLVEIMGLKNACIVANDATCNGEMRSCAGNAEPEHFPDSGGELMSYISEKGTYLRLSDLGPGTALRKEAELLNAELFIPLMRDKKMLGALFLGKKASGSGFERGDLDVLLPLTGTLAVAITNAKLFQELSSAQAQAAQREKMAVVGTLSAGINHEICNPLGIARGQCEMFLLNLEEGIYEGKTPQELLEKAKDIMLKVINETDRATAITRKLSSFARPAGGKAEKDVKVTEELDEVISLVQHDLRLDNIKIIREFDETVPYIEADRKQIQEIFFNIIRNAAQSIEDHGTIRLFARRENDLLRVMVEDSGKGIPEDVIKRIFDPFFSTKDSGKGAGLGLFIVKQIVERNKGSISVKSKEGEGTVFTVDFPVS